MGGGAKGGPKGERQAQNMGIFFFSIMVTWTFSSRFLSFLFLLHKRKERNGWVGVIGGQPADRSRDDDDSNYFNY